MAPQLRAIFAVLALSLLWAAAAQVRAQSLFEKLVSPGDVITSHAQWEKTCASCHEPFSKGTQRRLCLNCHEDVARDIASGTGFHGRRPEILKAECKTCHSDHKGRSADIVQLDKDTFNHASTDFALKGAHQTAQCEACHKPNTAYRKAPATCIACHEADDKHNGSLGKDCNSCHEETGWKKQRSFDHGKTRFPLIGSHKSVACSTCHAGERYRDLPRTCASCHNLQDVHAGLNGDKCETCHQVSKWDKVTFDHAKATHFALKGAHAPLQCTDCHKEPAGKRKLSAACVACHRKDDAHKGQLGEKCESCHNEAKWHQKVEFDHDLTRFPLIGMHATVTCEECHRSQTFKETPLLCASCHQDKQHNGTLGTQCASCHNPNGWRLWRFDHDRQTKFMLTGAHKAMRCESCHKAQSQQKIALPTTCYGCHDKDDAHRGAFGRACEKCHSTEGFRAGLLRR